MSESQPLSSGADARTTVAIITRNRRRSLLRTLDRLAALPERPPVVVVDNGSTDGTDEAVRSHPARARLLTPGHNTGAVGRNLAVRQATTPYVAFSDDDSWWEPGALETAADLFDTWPRLGLLAARTLVEPGHSDDPLNAVLARSPLPRRADLPGTPVLGFLACASVVRRTAFLETGGYHGLLFFGGEETLLAYDLTAAGWGVVYEPALLAHHGPDPGERPGRDVALRRNALLTTWLRRPLPVAAGRTAGLLRDCALRRPGTRRVLGESLARMPAALRRRHPLPAWVETQIRLLENDAREGDC
ncbi:glycosyltransferase family 2 protein [Streptomyces fulvorobeus]|uniref:GT2 family glycosyltransferase n=1 Tax=Streptomyces fulvorobeus TaxID=284028 RepID=A0A7J0CEK8_9ACTN|nr:glycosyltransferase [Streptomyces fulvorobeus]NYE44381.1 GT2 family glycosyltransferase [Streptomyces fulvorobeus]GFN00906.1 glycosyl transferase [Streptomyces fulvorobeus]